jgi:hypothetical protein
MSSPPTLLEGALRTSSAILIYGRDPPTAAILDAARAQWRSHHLLDWRDAAALPANGSLRREVGDQLSQHLALLVLVGAEVPDRVRELFSEIAEGQLNLPGEVRRLDPGTRLLVVSPVEHPDDGLLALFTQRLPAARALDRAGR